MRSCTVHAGTRQRMTGIWSCCGLHGAGAPGCIRGDHVLWPDGDIVVPLAYMLARGFMPPSESVRWVKLCDMDGAVCPYKSEVCVNYV